MHPTCKIIQGDCVDVIKTLPDESVQCCVTSPPYWGLRDYKVEGQIGLETTPQEYVDKLIACFREVRRVLKNDGTLWLVLGDSYSGSGKGGNPESGKQATNRGSKTIGFLYGKSGESASKAAVTNVGRRICAGLGIAPKQLLGIPWRVAFALQADGWWLRSDIIWCLSGGTWLYVKSKKGEMPMMLRDAARLDPATVKLWNGNAWTQVLGWSKSARRGDELEFVLRSGERISCTPTHRWPTQRGLLAASQMQCGDVIEHVKLPEPKELRFAQHIDLETAWFIGLYLAEGSRADDTIQISGHADEAQGRIERLRGIAKSYGGSLTFSIDGNNLGIRLYGRVLAAIIEDHISGGTAHDKALMVKCWAFPNEWLQSLLTGYLDGDGHWEADNKRYRIGFARNYKLERDLRTLCARLGAILTLNLATSTNQDDEFPSFKGEIRFEQSGHGNEKPRTEIMEIRKARCREVWDVGVEGEPHTFALASGLLTHNSKPNPMPESVTDRPTRSHEYIFLLTKNARYFYDHEAIKELPSPDLIKQIEDGYNGHAVKDYLQASVQDASATKSRIIEGYRKRIDKQRGHRRPHAGFNDKWDALTPAEQSLCGRNKRDVWTVPPSNFKEAHFATFPPDLIRPCILAGSKSGDTILDPFGGSGTVGQVCNELGRKSILIELQRDYIPMIRERVGLL